MKKILFALLLSCAACGGDDDAPEPEPEPRYQWEVTCDQTCDGETATTTASVCSTTAEAQAAIDQIVADCEAELATCETFACGCASQDDPPRCD